MSNDKWRFDPNEDYTREDYGENRRPNRGRKGVTSMKNSKQHYNSGKFDGKRMKRNNHRRDKH
jgi:hypothetical protein